ncbi:MAG TPA: ABC transporter permease [Candidatus Limnocylindrales bacterium]|nr:ABC transporter permease [Candidatus Limnocylindrales bacterium]
MNALLRLTEANIKSFVRDRAALFWTIAFPVMFVVLFGTLFGGSNTPDYRLGWVDLDGTPAAQQLHDAFASTKVLSLKPQTGESAALDSMHGGQLDAVVVVPKGYGGAVAAARSATGDQAAAPGSVALVLYTDPSQSTTAGAVSQIVNGVATGVNQALAGRPPVLTVTGKALQGSSGELDGASYFVPSILAMALMQLGVFAAIPLVQDREKLILKRLGATPLPRWTLVGSNVLMRLLIALAQTALILGIGIVALGVEVTGSWPLIIGIVLLGAVTFIALGYVIASFARTEEAANGITQVVQVPMMFLSGIFFPIALMPSWMKGIATILPLTYLGDALRQTMVGGSPFVPLAVGLAILAGWLVVCLAISARFFRWQ